MKNYLVGAVRPSIKIWNPWTGQGDDVNQQSNLTIYNEMYDISRASAKKFLAGTWQEIKHTAPVLDARMFQIAQWYMIKELWFQEPCNILIMGADTMFLRPTEIFGQFKEMRMFNYTDPKTHPEHPHNFNDDIRYYPATMDPAVWDLGERLMSQWFSHAESDWACGQHIHNHMLWSQGVSVEEMLKPQLAWQAMGSNDQEATNWNKCAYHEAHILHLHGSRNNQNRRDVMKQLAQHLEI